MIKYLHIGYPKNFSTSLQRSFFSTHPDIYHLGIGVGSNIGYRDKRISSLFELYLKSSKSIYYAERFPELKASIDAHYQAAFEVGAKAFGASSEYLSFSFTHDSIDIDEKLRRLETLFGRDVKIIVIVRHQLHLLQSMYNEYVRIGFPGRFNYFLECLIRYQERNFLWDLRYDLVYERLADTFGPDNICLKVFEDYRGDHKGMVLDAKGRQNSLAIFAVI